MISILSVIYDVHTDIMSYRSFLYKWYNHVLILRMNATSCYLLVRLYTVSFVLFIVSQRILFAATFSLGFNQSGALFY